jgi:hypothetical protein
MFEGIGLPFPVLDYSQVKTSAEKWLLRVCKSRSGFCLVTSMYCLNHAGSSHS